MKTHQISTILTRENKYVIAAPLSSFKVLELIPFIQYLFNNFLNTLLAELSTPILPTSQTLQHSRDASVGGRSAGDGGSVVDEANYATLHQEDTDDSSHYTLIRKPDGRADEPKYSTLG
ncbi:Sushi domain containing 1, partial [Caligus rogercresseyi]